MRERAFTGARRADQQSQDVVTLLLLRVVVCGSMHILAALIDRDKGTLWTRWLLHVQLLLPALPLLLRQFPGCAPAAGLHPWITAKLFHPGGRACDQTAVSVTFTEEYRDDGSGGRRRRRWTGATTS